MRKVIARMAHVNFWAFLFSYTHEGFYDMRSAVGYHVDRDIVPCATQTSKTNFGFNSLLLVIFDWTLVANACCFSDIYNLCSAFCLFFDGFFRSSFGFCRSGGLWIGAKKLHKVLRMVVSTNGGDWIHGAWNVEGWGLVGYPNNVLDNVRLQRFSNWPLKEFSGSSGINNQFSVCYCHFLRKLCSYKSLLEWRHSASFWLSFGQVLSPTAWGCVAGARNHETKAWGRGRYDPRSQWKTTESLVRNEEINPNWVYTKLFPTWGGVKTLLSTNQWHEHVLFMFFPTCQVRVVRFYVSRLLLLLLLLVLLVPNCDPVSSGPQPRSCEFSVPCRTSTAMMWGDMSERMSEDVSERMSKDMPKRMSDIMPERMSERLSKDMSERMLEDCLQSVREVESNRTHFRRWVVCLPSPDTIGLT